ncbi:putative lipase [Campylobacter lari]|uniref:hypothetical protein n=1 Tax=Campylobacter lari TaxID=201 RepID=UPI0021535FD5|nr:hypothetical protein [Campylobacter lari]MCR6530193.1 hypothetical protein [Campylobacter lari]
MKNTNKKNVILLGGSNSVALNGLNYGIKKWLNKDKYEFYNLALGACTAVQNLYELHRLKNQSILKNIELIVTESNINEINQNSEVHEKLPIEIIARNLRWFYEKLATFQTKILVLILPYPIGNYEIINKIHKKMCIEYGFNCIDMQEYYERKDLVEFGKRIDVAHQQFSIMNELGKRIVFNLENFKFSRPIKFLDEEKLFKIVVPAELECVKGEISKQVVKNSLFEEVIYRIDNSTILKFPKHFLNWRIVSIHTWNSQGKFVKGEHLINYSKCIFENRKFSLSKDVNFSNLVVEFHNDFIVDEDTNIFVSNNFKPEVEEHHQAVRFWMSDSKIHNYVDLVSIFLVYSRSNCYNMRINFKSLLTENIEIPEEYNFNYILPPIELYKEIIDEYCAAMDPKKFDFLQKQIRNLKNERQELEQNKNQEIQSLIIEKNIMQDQILKLQNNQKSIFIKQLTIESKIISDLITLNLARARIQNQLSYKLGQAMIVNSKSFFGYIRMPFVLSYIYDKHKQEQKIYQEKIKKDPSLALPSLEDYPDYKEALKEKECLTYKLGQALIQANKTWYGGGYIKLLFKIMKLKREFRNRKI